jgi:uncharacterized membrane protein YdjX (TVP38/TMEM64 family)
LPPYFLIEEACPVKFSIKEGSVKLAAFVLLTFLLAVIQYFSPGFYGKLGELTLRGDIEGITEYLRSFGAWALLTSFLLDVLINSLGFLPSIFLSTANGLLFGIPVGILVSWAAESVGVIISFFIMRFFLREAAEAVIEKSRRLTDLDALSGEKGFMAMALARTLPYFPSGLLTALGAVSKISARDYIAATFIGKFPSTAIEVILGYDAVHYEENINRLGLSVLLIIVVYGAVLYYKKRKK